MRGTSSGNKITCAPKNMDDSSDGSRMNASFLGMFAHTALV